MLSFKEVKNIHPEHVKKYYRSFIVILLLILIAGAYVTLAVF